MAGVRIQHETRRNCVLTLVDSSRLYSPPIECPACHRTHMHKTYHFRLDETGASIVSPEIAERLKRFPLQGGFRIANEVQHPPAQRVIAPLARVRLDSPWGRSHPDVVEHPTLGEPV